MAGISEQLELDVSAARSAIEGLGATLESAISSALAALDNITPTVDTSEITSGIEGGVEEADATVTPDAETGELTGEITGGVEEADSTVVPEAETGAMTGEITGGVEEADATVTPEPEVEQLTLGITGAVDAADSTVTPEADTSQIPPAVTGAIQSADSSVTVEADTSSLQSASAAVEKLTGNVDKTSEATEVFSQEVQQAGTNALSAYSTAGLAAERTAKATERTGKQTIATGKAIQVAIGVIATSAVVKFTAGLVSAASDNVEAQNKVTQVFKESAGAINDFASDSAQSLGLAESSTQEFAATFGNLFTALGLGTQEASNLSQQILTLGADLSSFNNIPVEDALNRLRSGLVGQIRPLRSLGISFGAAAVEAKALELGLVDGTGAATEAGKVQARFALIMEQTKNAQGDFARTSGDLANAQRILVAEFENARGEIGEGMLPAVLEVVDVLSGSAVPAFDALGKALAPLGAAIISGFAPAIEAAGSFVEGLAQRIGPLVEALGELLAAFGDAGGVVLDAFLDTILAFVPAIQALTPFIEAFSNAIAAIPEPVLRAIGTFFALRQVFLLVQTAAVTMVPSLAASSVAIAGVLGPIGIAVAGLTALAFAFGFLGKGSSDAGPDLEAVGEQIFGIAPKATVADASVNALGETVEGLDTILADFLQTSSEIQFSEIFFGASETTEILSEVGLSMQDLVGLLQEGEAGIDAFGEALESAEEPGQDLIEVTDGIYRTTDNLKSIFREAQEAAEETAAIRIAIAEASELVTAAEIEQIRTEETLADGTVNLIAVGDRVNQLALERQAAEEAAASAIENTITATGKQAESYEFLALALGQGALSEDELAIASESLGIELEALTPFIDAVGAQIEAFSSAASSSLPEVTDAINDLGLGITAEGIRDALQKQYDAIVSFTDNVRGLLLFFGPEVAQWAAEAGPLAAAALAKGEPEVVEAVGHLVTGVDDKISEAEVFFDELGAFLVTQTGEVIRIANENFEGLDLLTPSERAYRDAINVATQGGGDLAQINAVGALASTLAFGANYNPDKPAASATADAAAAVRGGEGALHSAADKAGSGATTGFEQGTEPIPGDAQATFEAGATAIGGAQPALQGVARLVGFAVGGTFIDRLYRTIQSGGSAIASAGIGAVGAAGAAIPYASSIGYTIGLNLGAGIASGIRATVSAIASEAASAVNAAEQAARDAADASSPSRLFADLGEDLGAGLAAGLNESDAAVVRAAEAVVANAAAGAAADGGGGVAFGPVSVQVNVDGNIDADQARRVGGAITEGMFAEAALQRRRIVVDSRAN